MTESKHHTCAATPHTYIGFYGTLFFHFINRVIYLSIQLSVYIYLLKYYTRIHTLKSLQKKTHILTIPIAGFFLSWFCMTCNMCVCVPLHTFIQTLYITQWEIQKNCLSARARARTSFALRPRLHRIIFLYLYTIYIFSLYCTLRCATLFFLYLLYSDCCEQLFKF